MKIKRIAIIGGGTAGWLAANHLGLELDSDPEIEITLIESKDVPTIGVGEGTVPYIMNGLKKFGISEADLLLTCDTTFKQGIKFVNWLDPVLHGDNYYYHSFDVPYPSGIDVSGYWMSHHKGPFDDVGIQARVCELGLSPKLKSSGNYEGVLSYAYHFNALKFANLLAKNAKSRFNVSHQYATITSVTKDNYGNITQLKTDEGDTLDFDFYADCSGFSSILIDKELEVPFVSKSNEILTDTVLVQQMPLKKDEEIKPYTTATAHKAGWIWDIPLTSRRGTGFVYASKYMNEKEAINLYAEYLGVDVDSLSPRKIPMEIGYRKEFWHKNCVALGLAQGFIEPLEATSILVTDFSAELLASNFPRELSDITTFKAEYNKVLTYVWEGVIDFIKLHYCLSDRSDSQFWIDNRDEKIMSDQLIKRLDKFKLRPPRASDFFSSRFDMFDEKNYMYVLYGMKFNTRSRPLSEIEKKQSHKLFESNNSFVKKAKEDLISHKSWLMELQAMVEK